MNIKVRAGRLEVRRNFFTMRVIEDWNRIPAAVKSMTNGYKFKAAYKKNARTHAVRLMGSRYGEPDESGERPHPDVLRSMYLYLRLGGPDYKYQVSTSK